MIYTTLKQIRKHNPCKAGWEKLCKSLGKTKADDELLPLVRILDSNGIEDAIWCLRAVEGHDREVRLFACDVAESVLHLFESKYPDDKRPSNAIETSRKYANGQATQQELAIAGYAARTVGYAARTAWAAGDAARTAGYAAWAAWAAGDAARTAGAAAWDAARTAGYAAWAAWAAEKQKQLDFFIKWFGEIAP